MNRAATQPATQPATDEPSTDEKWMQAALQWSWRGKGWTSPRPSVGCVLVREGKIIGGGHTQRGDGTPHAEVMALREAQSRGGMGATKGATAYVSLEPCSHWATTPPCSQALIDAGVSRVVVGIIDPNPRVAGRGFAQLRAAGIEVTEGVLERECFRAQDDFLHYIVHQTPFVTLKSAVSLDGKIALRSGQSKWITGEKARQRAHLLRHYHDAVLVGIETVLSDDPTLDVRLEGEWKQPQRIVLDSQARLPLDAKIWRDAPQLIVATAGAEAEKIAALREHGATVLELGAAIEWKTLLDEVFALGIRSVLIEGGARVAGSALQAAVVQKVAFFVAPLLMGEGKSALSGFEVADLGLAPRLRDVKTEILGADVLIEGYLWN